MGVSAMHSTQFESMMKRTPWLPIAGLLTNSTIWGLSWIAFRGLDGVGVHPLWATAFIYGAAFALLAVVMPRAFVELLRTPALWVLMLASGLNNACFNTAVAIGDVVRVVLLFYLMPVWAMLLARPLLHEPINARAIARVAVGLGGAVLVLYRPGHGMPLPQSTADWLALAGGMLFALNNVLLRGQAATSEPARAIAMFAGGLVSAAVGVALVLAGQIAWPAYGAPGALGILALWTGLFLIANVGLQIGASRLPVSLTSVIMLTEVLVASVSSWAAGAAELRTQELIGGALILAAPWIARERAR